MKKAEDSYYSLLRVIAVVVATLLFLSNAWHYTHHLISRSLFMSYFSVIITVFGYTLYLGKIYLLRKSPPPLSWVMFGFFTFTGGLVQLAKGGKAGSWCLLVTGAFCFWIALASYRVKRPEFTKKDYLFVALGLAVFVLYLLTRAPNLAATLATGLDFGSYYWILKDDWVDPHQDSPSNFFINSVKCVPALLALSSYNYATTVYLWMLTAMNLFVMALILLRRWYLDRAVTHHITRVVH